MCWQLTHTHVNNPISKNYTHQFPLLFVMSIHLTYLTTRLQLKTFPV